MSYFEGLKSVIPVLWKDKATIFTTKKVVQHHITNTEDVILVRDEPCKVILKGQSTSTQTIFGTDEYDAKLLVRTGLNIPAGAIVVVTDQNGKTVKYKNASQAYSGYYSHQELAMERLEKA